MADSKISALTSGNPAQSGDEIPIARGGANYKITAGSIASLGGDVDGPASSVDNQIALFDSTTGKLIKAATTTGVLKASSGVIAAATSGTDYVAPAGAFSGLSWQSVQTTGFTAVAFRAYPCNTTSAAFTVTLPASPSAGDQITLTDYAGTFATNNLTINPNGGKVNGSTSNYVVNQNRWSLNLVYVDSTQGWLICSTTNLTVPPPTSSVDYLVVGGGGGGAGDTTGLSGGVGPGGGGAGGYRIGTNFQVLPSTLYNITIGAGGNGGAAGANNGTSGTNSVFSTITSAGGGYGGTNANTGANGGSGGGAGRTSVTNSTGNTPSTAPSQGSNGGSGDTVGYQGGGGGGAGGAGANAPQPGASGGSGTNGGTAQSSSITGSSVYYAGGGGGGNGGLGGGTSITAQKGGGGNAGNPGVAGTPNTGGGGGAGSSPSAGSFAGGAGGSGVVIISYSEAYSAAITTGSPTYTVTGGKRIYTFTGNGSITF